jgi:hypothetical protein
VIWKWSYNHPIDKKIVFPHGMYLRLRVQGFEFRVQGVGFRVQGSGFRVQGSGLRF